MLERRLRNKLLLDRVVSPEVAASFVKSGMTLGTSGETKRGCPSAFFNALAERGKKGEVENLTLCTSSLPDEIHGILADCGALKRKLGSQGHPALRKCINSRQVLCDDVRADMLLYRMRCGVLGKLDLAVVNAIAINEEGFIIPSHTAIDISSYIEAAEHVIVEIDCSIPLALEGMYDHYLPSLYPFTREIPLCKVAQRIGVPYIPVPQEKIKYIVISNLQKGGVQAILPDEKSQKLAEHLVKFLKHEIHEGRLPPNLYPIEMGLGGISGAILKNLSKYDFRDVEIFSAVVGDAVLDLIDAGVCTAVTGGGLLLSDDGWQALCDNIDKYKQVIILRPLELTDHPELVRRLKLIALNGAIEADIYGHINASHVFGTRLVNGVGGLHVFASNAYLSIFALISSNDSGDISSIVPMVSHVDIPEHCVDVIVTEVGLADLRGLSPVERAENIINNCAHPDYRPLLREYLKRAEKEVGGHEPHILEEAFSFHQRFKEKKTMKMEK